MLMLLLYFLFYHFADIIAAFFCAFAGAHFCRLLAIIRFSLTHPESATPPLILMLMFYAD